MSNNFRKIHWTKTAVKTLERFTLKLGETYQLKVLKSVKAEVWSVWTAIVRNIQDSCETDKNVMLKFERMI